MSSSKIKNENIQIRVSSSQKEKLKKIAKLQKMSLSEYILSISLTEITPLEIIDLYASMAKEDDKSFHLARINELLMKCPKHMWEKLVSFYPKNLDEKAIAYVAGLIEQAAFIRSLSKPSWSTKIEALEEPLFASHLEKLRLYLLIKSPIPFRKRNIFIDSSVGDRV